MQNPILAGKACVTQGSRPSFGVSQPAEPLDEDEDNHLVFQWQANLSDPAWQAQICWQVDSLFEMVGIYDPNPSLRQSCIDRVNAGVPMQAVTDLFMEALITGRSVCGELVIQPEECDDWRQTA